MHPVTWLEPQILLPALKGLRKHRLRPKIMNVPYANLSYLLLMPNGYPSIPQRTVSEESSSFFKDVKSKIRNSLRGKGCSRNDPNTTTGKYDGFLISNSSGRRGI